MAFNPVEVGFLKIKSILGTSLISDIDEWAKALVEEMTSKFAAYQQGLASARPAAGHSTVFYKSTDTGVLEHDTGSAWEPVLGPGMSTAYTTSAAVTSGKEELTSATRPVLVMVSVKSIAGATSIGTAVVGGVTVSTVSEPSASDAEALQTFIVPANVKWKVTLTNATAQYRYLVL